MSLSIARRSFLGLAAGTSVAGTSTLALASTRTGQRLDERSLLLLKTGLVGDINYCTGEPNPLLAAGTPLELERQANNRFDSNAVAIRTTAGLKLGYISRVQNAPIAALYDAGYRLRVTVSPSEGTSEVLIRVAIYLET